MYHLCKAKMFEDAQKLVLNFDWLLARASLRDPMELIADVTRVKEKSSSATLRLVWRALKLALMSLQEDWRHFPAQLVGRLIGNEGDEEVKFLLDRARQWSGPVDRRGWSVSLSIIKQNELCYV